MGEEYPAKSFKSGNSVAIRLPAALGVEPGREWVVYRNADGDLVIRSNNEESATIDLSDIYGKAKAIKRMPFEHVERDWG